jgi:hypothetical protein
MMNDDCGGGFPFVDIAASITAVHAQSHINVMSLTRGRLTINCLTSSDKLIGNITKPKSFETIDMSAAIQR